MQTITVETAAVEAAVQIARKSVCTKENPSPMAALRGRGFIVPHELDAVNNLVRREWAHELAYQYLEMSELSGKTTVKALCPNCGFSVGAEIQIPANRPGLLEQEKAKLYQSLGFMRVENVPFDSSLLEAPSPMQSAELNDKVVINFAPEDWNTQERMLMIGQVIGQLEHRLHYNMLASLVLADALERINFLVYRPVLFLENNREAILKGQ